MHALLDRVIGRKNQQTRKMFLGRSETPLARQHRYKTCRYYDTIVSKTPQPKKNIANEINLAFTTANVQKMPTGRPSY